MTNSTVVTRFAPSPTGYLHVGGARTALFSWLLARHHGGRFVLRMEDTDLARSTEESVRSLLDDLNWLGLHWDNTELVFQSKRLDIYNQLIADLMARGLAYEAWETPQELDVQRKIAERARRAFIYRHPKWTDAQIAGFRAEGRKPVIRFAMPVKEYRFHDAVLDKEILLPAGQVQDFVIRKTDGMPTYHFAVVVDDAAMGVNHILRGQEHLLNTMNHIALQEALGYERPVYGHLPIIMNTDGSKMGKRDRDKKVRHETHLWMKKHTTTVGDLAAATGLDEAMLTAWLESDTRQLDGHDQLLVMGVIGLKNSDLPEVLVHDFRANGYFPEVLLNFLALLGWSPGGDKERMSVDEMVQLFKMEDIGKSNAKFNRDKLRAFSTEAAATMTPAQLLPRLRDYLALNPDSPLNQGDDAALSQVLTMNAGFHVLREVDEKSRFMFIEDSAVEYDQAAIDKVLLKNDRQGAVALADVATVLKAVEPWQAEAMETAIKDYCTTKNLGLGKVAQPIRVALCGSMVSPPIFQSLELMGREHTLARIARCLAKIA